MARPRGNFTNWQKGILRAEGFIPEEIKAWDEAANPNGTPHDMSFYSETFKDMRADRRRWKRDRLAEGWTKEQCDTDLYDYFQATRGHSPWEFLRGSYKPPRKLKDFTQASRRRATKRRERAKERTRRRLGGDYGT